ncbi:class I SAM-dependent methyltransferase [Streptomyces sp. NBC_01716]|uniref:class I SAM-dependent methyltransferase n=1 Tax=Streptomyces sp. NBC_01716 TaxID=2975917 RepID=UPI002E30B89D|nr:class I SAM-dependent methyltransferase [Streptomyces sp. NBC_01716]
MPEPISIEAITRNNIRRFAIDRENVFSLLGKEWSILPNVYPSGSFSSTEFFTYQDIYPPAGGKFLEIGCGAGVTAVTAAISGCDAVVASDINPQAVRNTGINIARHGVDEKVSVRHGDLFSAVRVNERFDCIFWNSNGIEMPSDYTHQSEFEKAFFDPGYESHRRYVEEGPNHLTRGGRLLIGFSGHGNVSLLRNFAERTGHTFIERARSQSATRTIKHPHLLLELVPT